MPIVNASLVLSDAEVRNFVPAMQLQYDRDFKPAWGALVPDILFSFVARDGISKIEPAAWPIFLNRHSQDPGALGWHTDEGNRIFGRVFVGDCIRYGLEWTTDCGHEVLETALDPGTQKVWQMPGGALAAFEACDAVESDAYAYSVKSPSGAVLKMTDFVLPAYFSTNRAARYDFRGILAAPCPALSSGGYMSIYKPGSGWATIQEDRADGMAGRRFLQPFRARRIKRQLIAQSELQIIEPSPEFYREDRA